MSVEVYENHVNDTGHLAVGDGHELYWEDWGNSDGVPVMVQHGGPGGSFNDSFKQIFDPALHRVVLWDQRGCGQSTPFASTEHNTTDHLLADMEKLRQAMGLEQMHVAGGSWGSMLSLVYAIRHPERVNSLLLWSLYTATQYENDWVNAAEHTVAPHFPAEWARFNAPVPEESRVSGDATMRWYQDQILSSDPETAEKYALEWTLWETALCLRDYDPKTLEKEVRDDPTTLSIARLETHYFGNKCFFAKRLYLEQSRCAALNPENSHSSGQTRYVYSGSHRSYIR